MVIPGRRIPIRGKRTGSVRIVTPKKLMSIVECPSHASVTCESLHFDGSGFIDGGAIGRQVSIVHSRKRYPSHRRTRELRSGVCSAELILLLVLFVVLVLIFETEEAVAAL